MIEVRGHASLSSDAALSDIGITDSNSDAVTLDPAFQSNTTSYTASVENDIAEITVTPTTNDGGATLEFLDENDATLADADGDGGAPGVAR